MTHTEPRTMSRVSWYCSASPECNTPHQTQTWWHPHELRAMGLRVVSGPLLLPTFTDLRVTAEVAWGLPYLTLSYHCSCGEVFIGSPIPAPTREPLRYSSGNRPDGAPDVRLSVIEHSFRLRCVTCGEDLFATTPERAADRDDIAIIARLTEQHVCTDQEKNQ